MAVSSVYRDRASQALHLVDGDLETAWNSKTGDLVGAYIEVRVPAEAEVVALAMTPGFTKGSGDHDLFLGNHRVSRVRVSRDGTPLGELPLDVASRTPVRLPVGGPGGVYRIEVLEVVPGTRPTWRETCISELQVLGRAPGAAPGTRLPRTGVGSLPTPRPDPSTLDRASVDRQQRRDLAFFAEAWANLAGGVDSQEQDTGEPMPEEGLRQDWTAERATILARIATLVDPVDPVRADAVRLRGAHAIDWARATTRRTELATDLDAISSALDALASFLGDDEARCRTARTLAGLRLRSIAGAEHNEAYFDEIDAFEADMTGEARGRDVERRSRALAANDIRLSDLAFEWEGNSRGVTTRLLRLRPPTAPAAAAEWGALVSRLEEAKRTCGWADR